MPCYSPMQAYRSTFLTKSGKRKLVFGCRDGYLDMPVTVACGQCIGCRLERSRQWAVRCMHEAQLYEHNSFITLTFNDEYLPQNRSLDVRIFQCFMKRLRKYFGNGIRFYHCGEYGEMFGRPHYHACLFNCDFPDKKYWKSQNGFPLFTSKILSELWPFGYSSIGNVTFESAAYVARYILKKVTGKDADKFYELIDIETGEVYNRKPEYTTMSRRPGIGKLWFDKYHTDVYPDDFVVVNGKKVRPPRFYDSQFEIKYPIDYVKLKRKRIRNAKKYASNNTLSRLIVRKKVQEARLKLLPRCVE